MSRKVSEVPPLLVVALPGNESIGREVAARLGGDCTMPEIHRFPDLRARRCLLVAPYLAYMRQDAPFKTRAGFTNPVCIGVHAVFAGDAHEALSAAGAGRIVTTDTIHHETNAIGVGEALAVALDELLV